MRKILLVLLAAALAAGLSFRLVQELGKDPSANTGRPGDRAQPVEVASVQKTTVQQELSLVGSLQAKEAVDVAPKVSGRVVMINVDRGDRVQEGDLIAGLDDEELQQQVSRADASLRVARAAESQRQVEFNELVNQLERFQALYDGRLISLQDLEQMRSRVDVTRAQLHLSEAQVSFAQAELEELRIRFGQSKIYAPISGVVSRRYVDAGALVNSSTPVARILNLNTMVSVVFVPERDLPQIRAGFQADISVDALPGTSFRGRVVRISPVLDPTTRTGEVEIEIPNSNGLLKAEMFIRVQLGLPTRREVMVIPRQAMVYREGRQGVFVLQSDVARFRSVETGQVRGQDTEIIRGLEEGELVATRGSNLLRDGNRVRLPEVSRTGGEE